MGHGAIEVCRALVELSHGVMAGCGAVCCGAVENLGQSMITDEWQNVEGRRRQQGRKKGQSEHSRWPWLIWKS